MRSSYSAPIESIMACVPPKIHTWSRCSPSEGLPWESALAPIWRSEYSRRWPSTLSIGCAEHPIDRLRRAGVPVSVNTDDPALFDTTLEREYVRCVDAFGWSDETLRAVARTSIEASFASAAIKARLLERLEAW